MSVNDYLYRPIPGPYCLTARIDRGCEDFVFRVNPEHEALAVAAARERQRIRRANNELRS